MSKILRVLGLVLGMIASSSAHAVTTADGVVLITQAAALAGGVTPGDAAGFPISITVPGSYRLGSDLTGTTNVAGIAVTVRNVTIDLNGFTIRGGNIAGIGIRSDVGSLTVRNGVIQFFKLDAISAAGPGLRVEDMRLTNNGRYGVNELYVNATPKIGNEDGHAIIRNNILIDNVQGITCQNGCHVEGNVISRSTYSAIIISQSGATVIGNTITNNGGYGVVGNYIGLGGNTIMFNGYCHTSGVMLVMEKNAVYPTSGGSYCTALPGN